MSFFFSMLLPVVVCLALAAGASIVWWETLRTPWLFLVVGILSLLGLDRVVQACAELLKLFVGRGYFLEGRAVTMSAIELAEQSITRESMALSAVTVALGVPLLFWLKRALESG